MWRIRGERGGEDGLHVERTGSGHRGCGQGRGGRRPGRGLGECGLLLQASSLLFHTRPMLIIKHGCRSSGARELLAMANVLSAPGPLDQMHTVRGPQRIPWRLKRAGPGPTQARRPWGGFARAAVLTLPAVHSRPPCPQTRFPCPLVRIPRQNGVLPAPP